MLLRKSIIKNLIATYITKNSEREEYRSQKAEESRGR